VQDDLFETISGAFRTLTSTRNISKSIENQHMIFLPHVHHISPLYLYKISRSETSQKISYSESVKLTCLKLISGAFRNPNFHREYLESIEKPTYDIFTTCTPIYLLCLCKISGSETSQK
jgi:hypothetical protein